MRKFVLPTIYILTLLCLTLAGCTEDIPDPLTHSEVLGLLRGASQEPPEGGTGDPVKDTSRIAFVAMSEDYQISLVNPDGSQLTSVTDEDGYAPFWSPDGAIAFFSGIDSTIHVVNTDGSTSTIVVDNLPGEIFDFDAHFSWSQNGRIALTLADIDMDTSDIYAVDADGGNMFLFVTSQGLGFSYYPSWSPDSTKIAFVYEDLIGDSYIYTAELNVAGVQQLTFTGDDYEPAWSPDGQKIAFVSDRDSNYEVYLMNTDGTNKINITNNFADDERPSWSPDGTEIAFQSDRDDDYEIYIMNADGTNQTNITNNPASEDIMPEWSPQL